MIWVVVPLVALYTALVVVMYLRQRSLLYRPGGPPGSPAAADLPDMAEVTLRTDDGLALLAWYAEAPPGAATLVYLPGNGGNLLNRATRARAIIDRGYGLLLVSWRGYSGNPGRPTETGLYRDARAAMGFLRRVGVGPETCVYYGESLGAAVAVDLALATPPAGVVLDSPFTSIPAVAQYHYWYLPAAWLVKDRFPTMARIGRLTCPLLVMHGQRDAVTPFAHGRRLLAAAPEPKYGFFPPDAGHTDIMMYGGDRELFAFLDRTVGPGGMHPPVAGLVDA